MNEGKSHADGGTEQSTTTVRRDLSAVRDHREDLEDLARSNLPVARIARALLDAEAATRGE